MEMTGLKTSQEDPNFLNHWEQLQNVEVAVINVYNSISNLTNSLLGFYETSVSTSTTISSTFDANDGENYQNSQKAVAYLTQCKDYCNNTIKSDVEQKCLAPLRECLNKIGNLKKIFEERKLNKVLYENTSDSQEMATRQELYTRYTTEYITGVDEIVSQHANLIFNVFKEHQAITQGFISHINQSVKADE